MSQKSAKIADIDKNGLLTEFSGDCPA